MGTPKAALASATRMGRPTHDDITRRDSQARQVTVLQLVAAFRYLKSPSVLSDAAICDRLDVRQKATALSGYRYPRSQVVIAAITSAWSTCWEELGETDDACYLQAVADAMRGLSRRQSAERARICETEVSKRRRKGAEIIVDQFLVLLR